MGKKLVYSKGVNDADYVVQPTINGMRVTCPFYQVWVDMLKRCYDAKYQSRQPTYIDCITCKEWLIFSAFKAWMETRDWQGKELDKDLLVNGNKVYSPEACVFVDRVINNFTTDRGAARGDWPIGVIFCKNVGKFRSRICNPFTKKKEHLGYFVCSDAAHQAWRKRKHQIACQLADLQTDERVANALRTRYL